MVVSTTSSPEKCRGELRGPVLWSETMSARSSSAGLQDVYVCSPPQRAYAIPENQVLAAALVSIRDAGRGVDSMSAQAYDDDPLQPEEGPASLSLPVWDEDGDERREPEPPKKPTLH